MAQLAIIHPPPVGDVERPPSPINCIVLGVVVEQDATLCAVKYDARILTRGEPMMGEAPTWETHYTLLRREVIPAAGDYPALARRVNHLARKLYNQDSKGQYHVLVDASEIGQPIVDAIRDAIIPYVHVTGVRMTDKDQADLSILWRTQSVIGLGYLVSRLQAIVQGGRLHVHPDHESIVTALHGHPAGSKEATPDVRSLALCCAAEFAPVRYDVSPDLLPDAAF